MLCTVKLSTREHLEGSVIRPATSANYQYNKLVQVSVLHVRDASGAEGDWQCNTDHHPEERKSTAPQEVY